MLDLARKTSFIARNPSEARPFAEDTETKKWKLWQQAIEVMPDLPKSVPEAQIADLEAEYRRVKGKRAESICNKCGQPKTQEAWTRVDLASIAKQTSPHLAGLYGACYLTPTFHSHATGFDVGARFQRNDGKTSYRETSENEARQALLLGHNLILQHLGLQNDYFKLGLESQIQPRIDAFTPIWSPSAQ